MARWKQTVQHLVVAACIGSVGALGCGKSEPPKAENAADNDIRAAADSGKPKEAASGKAADDGFHHPFDQAVRQIDEAPNDCCVPETTCTGKSIYRVFKDVKNQWDGIRFTTAEGKQIHYSATVQTALGDIDIELRPDLAPNHVRSFVALARAQYYEGLFFDRINHEEYTSNPGVCNDFVEAGCPIKMEGDNIRYNSVGYWLYPEIQPAQKATHIEGTVGACHGMEKDSAGCKFYISLSKAPFNDENYTIFGQVTHGLDVVRRIYAEPIAPDDDAAKAHFGLLRPDNPVMIYHVLIHTREDGAEGKK
jgi:cyclophilin family peptidyl-prolyl cis-trans isomerase